MEFFNSAVEVLKITGTADKAVASTLGTSKGTYTYTIAADKIAYKEGATWYVVSGAKITVTITQVTVPSSGTDTITLTVADLNSGNAVDFSFSGATATKEIPVSKDNDIVIGGRNA